MNQSAMTWSGGNCPACGETMPTGVVRCRYCHTSLVATDSVKAVTAVVVAEEGTRNPVASEPDIDEFMSSDKSATIKKRPEKKKRAKGQQPAARIAPSRPQTAPVEPSRQTGQNGTDDYAAQQVTAGSLHPQASTGGIGVPIESSAWSRLLWVVAALLLAPLCVSGPVPGASLPISTFVRPMVHSGDEPHYLVLINSVVNDGDIDVANNYADVHRGGEQAGRKFAGWALDHHVNWYWQSHLIHWWQAYETQYARWKSDSEGHPVPTLQADSIHRPVNKHEYSQHPPGLAWVLAPFVWPFRKTSLLEPVVLLCSGLVTIAGLWAFYQLLRPSGISTRAAVLITAVVFLGTPVWHYARTLYVEPYLMACALGGYAACLRFNRFAIAGLLLGIGTLLKIPFAVIAAPLIVTTVFEKRWREVISLAAPIAIAVALQLVCNQRAYGNWWKFPQKWEWGYPLFGLGGLAFSWQHGLLLFAPIVLVSLAIAVPKWFQQRRREAVLIGTAAILYILVMSCWAQWWGGTCYSARLIMPVVPFLLLPMGSLIASSTWKTDWRIRALTWTVAVVSVGFGVIGAFSCEHVWGKHPLQIVLRG